MTKSSKLVAVFSVAGTMLALSQAAFAQERLRQAYIPPVYVDCYYDIGKVCGPAGDVGAYAALGPVGYGSYSSYAAIGLVGQPAYLGTTRWFGRGLRNGDWTAIHGAGNQ